MDWQEARETLRKWREDNARCSNEIVKLWEDVLESHAGKMGTEQWLALEQVFVAALDCGMLQLADRCLKTLKDRFPSSLRIKRLTGMKLEAIGRHDQAMDLYDSIIKADETQAQARKRKVAILKTQKRVADAIHELSDYLKLFMGDQEAWLELCDLYIGECEYGKAAFCLEEVILLNPHCHFYHQKYAEIRYTMGGTENLEIARAYFCQAVKLKDDNARALYGILLTCGHLASNPKTNAAKKKECLRLVHWAGERMRELYTGEESSSSTSTPPLELNSSAEVLASANGTSPSSSSSGGSGSGGAGSQKSKKKPVSPSAQSSSGNAVVSATTTTVVGKPDGDRRDPSDVEAIEDLISALALIPASSAP